MKGNNGLCFRFSRKRKDGERAESQIVGNRLVANNLMEPVDGTRKQATKKKTPANSG